jgi:hypothetical protein
MHAGFHIPCSEHVESAVAHIKRQLSLWVCAAERILISLPRGGHLSCQIKTIEENSAVVVTAARETSANQKFQVQFANFLQSIYFGVMG